MSRSRGDLSLCVPAAILPSGGYRVPAHTGRLMEGRSGSLLRKWGGGGGAGGRGGALTQSDSSPLDKHCRQKRA